VDGLKIPGLSLKTLIKNKEAAGREKDLLNFKILRKNLKEADN